jgi:hypothetical protein
MDLISSKTNAAFKHYPGYVGCVDFGTQIP